METQTLFAQGDGGCHTFRIPTIIGLPSGRVIVFCEARRASMSDSGAIDIVCRVSDDGCASFSAPRVVARGGRDTVGNPCPIYDPARRRLFLLYNSNEAARPEAQILRGNGPRDVWVMTSDDEGETWLAPRRVTSDVKKADWTWYALGPCHGVSLADGRLIVGANHACLDQAAGCSGPYIAHTVFSDDHGETWQVGADLAPGSNECALTAYADEAVLVNARYIAPAGQARARQCRLQAFSAHGGEHFGRMEFREELPDPCCQGSLLTVRTERGEETLFSNAASLTRDHLTVYRSADRGQTWQPERLIAPGPSAYSDMAQLPDGRVAVIFERGEEMPYERLDLSVFSLKK